MRISQGVTALLVLALWMPAASAQVDQHIDDIRRALDNGNPQQAYHRALEVSPQAAGDIRFDYWFGLAALESGHSQRAIFAFERVLMRQPGHHRARLELARAHFLLGEDQAARRYFEQVLAADPPPKVKDKIGEFLAILDRRRAARQRRWQGHIALSTGYDSNINSATSDETVDIPALGEVTLTDGSRAREDSFVALQGTLRRDVRLSKHRRLFAEVSGRHRKHLTTNAFETSHIGATAGGLLALADGRLALPVNIRRLYVDDTALRDVYALAPRWSRALGNGHGLSVSAQLGQLRYPEQAARDVRLLLGSTGWTYRLTPRLQTAVGGYWGDEQALERAGEHNGRQYLGVRLGGQWTVRPDHQLRARLSYQRAEHDADHPVFDEPRQDDLAQASLGWRWRLAADWALDVGLEHHDNASTLSLFEYQRTQARLEIRYAPR